MRDNAQRRRRRKTQREIMLKVRKKKTSGKNISSLDFGGRTTPLCISQKCHQYNFQMEKKKTKTKTKIQKKWKKNEFGYQIK